MDSQTAFFAPNLGTCGSPWVEAKAPRHRNRSDVCNSSVLFGTLMCTYVHLCAHAVSIPQVICCSSPNTRRAKIGLAFDVLLRCASLRSAAHRAFRISQKPPPPPGLDMICKECRVFCKFFIWLPFFCNFDTGLRMC